MINPLWAELITSIINRVFLCGAEVNDLAERVKEKTKIFFLFQPFPCLTFGRLKKKKEICIRNPKSIVIFLWLIRKENQNGNTKPGWYLLVLGDPEWEGSLTQVSWAARNWRCAHLGMKKKRSDPVLEFSSPTGHQIQARAANWSKRTVWLSRSRGACPPPPRTCFWEFTFLVIKI